MGFERRYAQGLGHLPFKRLKRARLPHQPEPIGGNLAGVAH